VTVLLERQIDSAVFERTMLANQKLSTALRVLPQDGIIILKKIFWICRQTVLILKKNNYSNEEIKPFISVLYKLFST
jgi:hypothetical protein